MDKEILLQSILLLILNSCPFEEQSIVFTVQKNKKGKERCREKSVFSVGNGKWSPSGCLRISYAIWRPRRKYLICHQFELFVSIWLNNSFRVHFQGFWLVEILTRSLYSKRNKIQRRTKSCQMDGQRVVRFLHGSP